VRREGPYGDSAFAGDKDDKDRDSATGLSGVTQNRGKVLPAAQRFVVLRDKTVQLQLPSPGGTARCPHTQKDL